MVASVGQRIEARCTRCKDLTGHIVVSMLNGEIAKVECCACSSVHKYYPPAKKKEEAAAKPVLLYRFYKNGWCPIPVSVVLRLI